MLRIRWALLFSLVISVYCKQITDKKFQTCDWRVRPLSPEMIEYARKDTHFLAYLAKSLLEKLSMSLGEDHINNGIQEIYRDSQQLCLRRYKKPALFSDKYFRRLSILQTNSTRTQVAVFEQLWVN